MSVVKTMGNIGYGIAQPFGALIGGIKAGLGMNWEGWERNRLRNRPGTRLTSQDTDLNYGTREQMVSEARALCQTMPLARRLVRTFATYCIGSCEIKWNTGDPIVDSIYEDNWKRWMPLADANGVWHFRQLARIAMCCWKREGDVFAQLIDSNGYGQVKLIESDRVMSTRGGVYNVDVWGDNQDRGSVIGGVIIGKDGRPSGYRVLSRTHFGTFIDPQDIPIREIKHVYDSDRADAWRGVTDFHVILNKLRDLREIDNAEITAVKRLSKLALLVKTKAGNAKGFNPYSPDGLSSPNEGSQSVQHTQVNDGMDAYMFPDEEMRAMASDRPSPAWTGFIDYIIRQIAIGFDLPVGVVWSMAGLGGPATRTELKQAERTFKSATETMESRFICPIAAWQTTKDIARKRIPFHPNWNNFKVKKPAFISIDAGRDSKAGIAENLAGLLTATDWFEEDEKEFEEKTDRLAYEADYRKKAIAKYPGLTVADIRQTTPNGNSAAGKGGEQDDVV